MEYIVISIIVICVCAYICYPFFRVNKEDNLFTDENVLSTENIGNYKNYLEEQKLELYSAIKEIELDFDMGKLSEEDFKELRQSYIYEASKVIKKIEEHTEKGKRALNDNIEDEIKIARQHVKSVNDEIEEEIKRKRGNN